MVKLQKYRFVLMAYFSESLSPDDVLKYAEEYFGESRGNEIISMKYFGLVER